MISTIITELGNAFGKVVDLVGNFFGDDGLFGAIENLSTNIF